MQYYIESALVLFLVLWIAYQISMILLYVFFFKRLKIWTKNLSKLPPSSA